MKKILVSLLFVSSLVPVFVRAQADTVPLDKKPVDMTNLDKKTPAPPAVPAIPSKTATLQNPLAGVTSISALFYKIVGFAVSVSYVVIAAFLILAGFKFIAAQGKPEELEKAKKTFYYTIAGAALIIGAQVITAIIQKIIEGLK